MTDWAAGMTHEELDDFVAWYFADLERRASDVSVDDLLVSIPTGANGEREFGFGQLRKSLTAEQLEYISSWETGT